MHGCACRVRSVSDALAVVRRSGGMAALSLSYRLILANLFVRFFLIAKKQRNVQTYKVDLSRSKAVSQALDTERQMLLTFGPKCIL